MRARRLTAVALAFVAALAVFAATRGGERVAAGPPAGLALDARPALSTAEEVRRLQAAVRRGEPREAELAAAYAQRARETGDPSFYARAEAALGPDPSGAPALTEAAALAAARHDFRAALALGRRARAAAPDVNAPYAVLVDALVELGRYDAAERALQQMIGRHPDLGGYARISYLRELHGDLDGAVAAMRRAVAAAGSARSFAADTNALLGELELRRGREAAAGRAFRMALAAVPGHPAASAGMARFAAATGRDDLALARWRRLVTRMPLPEYAIALGEAELAAGRTAAAERAFDLVRAQERIQRDAGVDVDAELAVFEASHGSAARAVRLGRRAWASAPSVRSADALGWALTRAGRPHAGLRWADRALALGWRDPLALHHAGLAALAAGERAEGERRLRAALRGGLAIHPLLAAEAREALR